MKKYLIALSFLMFLLSPAAVSAQGITCNVHHQLIHHGDTITSGYHFSMENGKGVLKVHGRIESDGKRNVISRNIIFDYQLENGMYHAKSKDLRLIPVDDVPDTLLAKHYPAFFTSPIKRSRFRSPR